MMDSIEWVNLFGKRADDPVVAAAVAGAGVTKALRIGEDELGVSADLPGTGMTIGFTDESVVKPGTGHEGQPILTSVLMIVQHASKPDLYTGPLPHGLVVATSKDALRARLGTPLECDDDLRWDAWIVDGLRLTVTYARDLASIARVSLAVPEAA